MDTARNPAAGTRSIPPGSNHHSDPVNPRSITIVRPAVTAIRTAITRSFRCVPRPAWENRYLLLTARACSAPGIPGHLVFLGTWYCRPRGISGHVVFPGAWAHMWDVNSAWRSSHICLRAPRPHMIPPRVCSGRTEEHGRPSGKIDPACAPICEDGCPRLFCARTKNMCGSENQVGIRGACANRKGTCRTFQGNR
jgi:hypothetical protein